MEQDWGHYFTQINGQPASILLDLNALTGGNRTQRPFLCRLDVQCVAPSADGWPGDQEFARLIEIEEGLDANLAQAQDGQFVGSTTYNGERILFFYLAKQEGTEAVIQEGFKDFPDYHWRHTLLEDPDWQGYLDFLYPSEEEMQVLQNERVLHHLKEAGDTLETPRRVDHWLYFPSVEALQQCKTAISTLNYQIEEESEQDGEWCLQIYRDDSVESVVIDAATLELFRLAREVGGNYDGWETFVVKK